MGKSQRTKGATFEREIAAKFSANYGTTEKRNIGQARDGGNDIDVGPLVIECKRRKRLGTVYGWLAQAVAAAGSKPNHKQRYFWFGEEKTREVRRVPVVVAREDNGFPIVIMALEDFFLVTNERLPDLVFGQDR